MNNDPNDKSDNPYRPKTLKIRDLHHDAQLYRDLAIANAQTVALFGALPPGGLPVVPKRKPNLPRSTETVASAPAFKQEDDPMKLHQVAAAAMVPLVVAVGCSMTHGDPKHPNKNPHPVRRYEVTATADAPGPWDSVKGYIGYEITNVDCVPRDSFTGGQNVPNIDFNFEMTRVDDRTWRGYFYGDFLQDEDYFELGACHWGIASVGPEFIAHSESFTTSDALDVFLHKSPETEYFRKSDFINRSQMAGVHGFTPDDPEIAKHPDAFFPITVTVKEAIP